jgi:hypothetical protein
LFAPCLAADVDLEFDVKAVITWWFELDARCLPVEQFGHTHRCPQLLIGVASLACGSTR